MRSVTEIYDEIIREAIDRAYDAGFQRGYDLGRIEAYRDEQILLYGNSAEGESGAVE